MRWGGVGWGGVGVGWGGVGVGWGWGGVGLGWGGVGWGWVGVGWGGVGWGGVGWGGVGWILDSGRPARGDGKAEGGPRGNCEPQTVQRAVHLVLPGWAEAGSEGPHPAPPRTDTGRFRGGGGGGSVLLWFSWLRAVLNRKKKTVPEHGFFKNDCV